MKKASLKPIVVLVVICMLTAALMAAVNAITAPKIEAAKIEAEQKALAEVLPENGGFEKLDGLELPEGVDAIHRDLDGEGFVAMLSIKGYDASKPISAAVGFTGKGEITSVKIISAQGETSGIGSRVTEASFLSRFAGKTQASMSEVDTLSGATISSGAVVEAVKAAAEVVGTYVEVK